MKRYINDILTKILTLTLLLLAGANVAWGQVTPTTNTDDPVYYLIQSYVNTAFYMRPNGEKVTTLNSLTDEMKWFFLDAGTGTEGSDEVQYYYICRKNGDNIQYMYFSSPDFISTSSRVWIELKATLGTDTDNYKFYIVANTSYDGYNIIPKGTDTSSKSSLNKQGGNAGANGIQVGSGLNDIGSCWYIIGLDDYEWTLRSDCFTVSDATNRYFYKIKSQNNANYYIKPDGTNVKTSNSEDDDMIWYFEEAESDALMTYYYIRHANTGQYLRYTSNGVGQDNAVVLANHTGNETGDVEARFQFVVARGTNSNETVVNPIAIIYNIIPKLFINTSANNIRSLSCDGGQGKALKTKENRSENTTHWSFVSTEYSTVCANPTITFSSATGKATITTTTTRSTIYYTTDGTEPSSSNGTQYVDPFDVTEQTTIKAIVTRAGFTSSGVTTKTIYQVATPAIQNNGSNAVSITCATEGATIYYTTDGGTPTTSSTTYTVPLTENVSGVTINAIAVKDGLVNSVVGSGNIELQCAKPSIVKIGNEVTISCSFPSSGVTILYIKNGGDADPNTTYTGAISVESDDVIKAIATASYYANSPVATKTIHDNLTPTEGKYLINSQTDFETFVDMANEEDGAGYHYVLKTDVNASSPISQPFTGIFEADADANGNYYKISGLTHALFNTVNGGTVKNVMLDNVNISNGTYVGAIAGVASGYTRIYNCGVLDGSVGGSEYVGGLVGWLKDDSRVINCFSYANITGGNDVAGIVGHNEIASTTAVTTENSIEKYANLRTAVVNCIFYGNITGGSNRYPVYGGAKIVNNTATGINNYDFYRAEATVGTLADYNCSWPAKEEYLTRFEFHRNLLNSNRELCGWWVGAPSAPSTMATADVQAVPKDASLMAKWVLDTSVAPYPILKKFGKYASPVNIDADASWRETANEWEGKKLGTINVTVNPGDHAPSGIGNIVYNGTNNHPAFVITDMDTLHTDYCYKKIQLPYYNTVFGNPNGNTWAEKYGGNYTDHVVIGWKVSASGGTEGELVENWQTGYNFADRNCTAKDANRVFAQGGYYYVPDGVENITITAQWAEAVYFDNTNHSYDRVYMSGSKSGTHFAPAGTRPTTLDNGKTVLTNNLRDLAKNTDYIGDVYDHAVVLVGNHQYRHSDGTNGENIGETNSTQGFTVISADFDFDEEPDNCLIWQLGQKYGRQSFCPIRFDFLPVEEIGLAMKEDGSTQYYALGCYRPLGHFEVTETSLIHFGQFEFSNISRTLYAPLILNGGIFDQYTKGTSGNAKNDANDCINYIILGGNVRMPSFTPGAHVNKGLPTRHCAVNVIGGIIDNIYLTGNYSSGVLPNQDNPHCYIDGGRLKHVAAAGKEGINGDVTFKINHSKIWEFYGGSTMDDTSANTYKIVKGNINVDIDNSIVDKYCGGPKFGDMVYDKDNPENSKTITTNANNTTFGVYYGGGNGGTSYVQYDKTDVTGNNGVSTGTYNWNGTGDKQGHISSYNPGAYRSTDNNYMADYDMEIVNTSAGTESGEAVCRTYFYAAQFSATNTGPIINNLTNCTVLTNFYGGGNLGGVYGDVTSKLKGTTHIHGSAFGAGFSASVPEVTINNKDKVPPTIDVYTGIITPQSGGTGTTYTWTHETSLGGQTLNTTNRTVEVDGIKYFYTEKALDNLGTVTGNVILNIAGDTKIGTSGTGHNVYGGGDASAVSGNATVTLAENAEVFGDVFGGGNNGEVGGTATVRILPTLPPTNNNGN